VCRLAALDIPQHNSISANRSQSVTIRAEVNHIHTTIVTPDLLTDKLPALDVPEAHCAISAARSQYITIGTEINANAVTTMTTQGLDKPLVPQDVP
jgi:hypothetical protein